ncbi:M10 family metallopeptidase C-terminal domain-containing protein [Sphingomonas sp. ID0503]|uniref:M10 family metallopeptidase C-terminal domain-containing protein n=1 Tax=Sphingomonas sp. ID0503 TaxID=3399691 RepID=UPI003AFA0923
MAEIAGGTGTSGNDLLVVNASAGFGSIDGKAGDDTLRLDLSGAAGNIYNFNSGGVIANDLPSNDPLWLSIGLSVEHLDLKTGGGNEDLFMTATGNDTVSTGGGDDVINTRAGKAVVNGGTGTDRWIADFSTATSSAKLDLALAGKQSFLGGSVVNIEAIELKLGSGNDRITTLGGKVGLGIGDWIDGGAGNDTISVGGGLDTIFGGAGDDLAVVDLSLEAGDFTTSHSGGVISNNLAGAGQRGVFLGGVEHVSIKTGGGNDAFFLFDGNDTVSAGAGNDVIDTRAGKAVVDGGAGVDRWIADFSTATKAGKLDLNSNRTQSFLGGTVVRVEAVELKLGSANDSILTLTGKAGLGVNDYIDGGAGDDTIRAGGGRDTISGGLGNDLAIVDLSLEAGDFTTSHSGGVISNNLGGDADRGVFLGGIERVNIKTGGGNDQLFLFDGSDTVSTGSGNDVFDTRTGKAVVDGGAGTDQWVADLSAFRSDGRLDLTSSTKQSFLGGSVVRVESVSLQLGSGDDRIVTLTGSKGRGINDTIHGGAGDDTIQVGGGRDVVNGGEGKDTLIVDFASQAGAFTTGNSGGWVSNGLAGKELAEVFIGGFERVSMKSGKGADYLYVASGSDTLDGGAGADTLYGRGGNDRYYVDNAGDVVNEYADEGTDTVFASTGYTLTNNVENLTLAGGRKINGTGNGLNNVLTGNGAANLLKGLDGNDTLSGGGGNDRLDGGAGADRMTGGRGDDTYVVDHSRDKVIETSGQGTDTVLASVSYSLAGQSIERLTLTGGADISATGNGVGNVVIGNGGRNTLVGGGGEDRLTGGKGADTFRYDAVSDSKASAADRITDFSLKGQDRIDLSRIDASTKTKGNQSFDFIGNDAFHKEAGELRVITKGDLTSIYGDVNGDGKADFRIDLTGRIQLASDDFLL